MPSHNTNQTPIGIARLTGALYLIIIICAGFSEGFVRESLIIPGDAATTAANILASEDLYRLGFVSDLIAFICDLVVSVLLYVLLKPVNKTLALTVAALRLLAHPAIASINLLNHFMVLPLLGGADYLNVFDVGQLQAMALLLLDAHRIGYLIAGAFFGLHCFLLGFLLYRSDLFPRIFGILMTIAGIGYLLESFGNFLFPEYESILTWVVAIPAVLGEVTLCLWMLVKGVKTPKPTTV